MVSIMRPRRCALTVAAAHVAHYEIGLVAARLFSLGKETGHGLG